MSERRIVYTPLADVVPAEVNPKQHHFDGIKASLATFGYTEPILLDERTGRLIAGHGRLEALAGMHAAGEAAPAGVQVSDDGSWLVPVVHGWASGSDEEARAYLIASNRLVESGGWDEGALADMLTDIAGTDERLLAATGYTLPDLDALLASLSDLTGREQPERPSLRDRFLVPPFDVLDARQGWWRERKRAWLSLGIRSEIGRGDDTGGGARAAGPHPGGGGGAWRSAASEAGTEPYDSRYRRRETRPGALLLKSDSGRDSDYYRRKQAVEARLGREISTEEFQANYYVAPEGNGGVSDSGTSVFDPVLTELIIRWYTPPDALVLDPFAGGSVRGIVTGLLGRGYHGVDLSAEQVAANEAQRDVIAPGTPIDWTVGDCREVLSCMPAGQATALLTCPPYGNLERYSDDPRDLSTLNLTQFRSALGDVIAETKRVLDDHTFAVWVLGHVRDGQRGQVDLAAAVIEDARAVGFTVQNHAVLITPIGSLAVRAPKQFSASRALGRSYQDVVVLTKGSAKEAAARCGEVDVADPAEFGEPTG